MDVSYILNYLNLQLAIASQSTWDSIAVISIHGGWMIFFYFFFHIGFELLHDREQGVFAGNIEFIYLAVNIPKTNEQTPRAVENFFAHIAGAHVTQDLIEKYFLGELQPWFAFEIISIEGYLQFVIYTPKKMRDLVEASLYAQYPDAEIVQIEDYTTTKPDKFPDTTYDMWGTEFTLAKPDEYPLLTYREFEHSVTKEYFKDPMAALLETMSRIGKGEECWFQIFLQPTDKAWQKRVADKAAELTNELVSTRATPEHPFPLLHRGETDLVEAVYRKGMKNGFKAKIRCVYVAKKENYNAKRVQYGLVGAMKQFSRDDSNGLKPLYSLTGVTGHYLFKDFQKNVRKNALMAAYKRRSGTRGGNKFILNVEELATIWHFPLAHAVRAPSLASVSAKRGEAPGILPLETEFFEDDVVAAPEPTGRQSRVHKKYSTHKTVDAPHAVHEAPPPPNLPIA
ncbi:MAG: hypothetical protein A2848_00465 [Candidatus Magasanikbacteria bacterium RIFCSPHIGHO2_01_FULL_50_8]|uniref:DUF8128 domain-containing protein n=2 Tax=Candidatus Magasanikiibacteriota TaxID=1752731 RepID=A0A1F6LTS7_9BACT|nr:MAG: hypothetical protein A2848_00465 [Candidatus Magasanikbacteria bacterium RIFCSPHIGHO2_01_FULL_50_8]OGH67510.1 MAG: hypothetical protein A3C15_00280 [Candidatus Magasanikbacteria bacterium RIFCSPHIGHO2_02_FULL_50_9b]